MRSDLPEPVVPFKVSSGVAATEKHEFSGFIWIDPKVVLDVE